jgi:hypothetical protein
MKLRLFLVLTGILAIIWFGWNLRDVKDDTASPTVAQRFSQLAPPEPVVPRGAVLRRPAGQRIASLGIDEFRSRYGDKLQASFAADGRLAQIKGQPAEKGSGKGFDPKNPQQVIARATEIVEAAAGLLRLRSRYPLSEPKAQTGKHSAQVFFTQTREGTPFAPQGQVSVTLGSEGELLGLYSDYLNQVTIANSVALDAEAAARSAEASSSQDGHRVVWVSGNEARQAYEFSVRGRQVVVDAQNGAILYKRDRREF